MGVHANISYDRFPPQSERVGSAVKICFDYDAERFVDATMIRDDMASPFQTIFQLADGRVVLATECQYKL